MKLFITESDTTLKSHECLMERLGKNAQEEGSHHIFLVPDRFTLGVEREICQNCFENGSFSVDTFSFTRLAKHVLGVQVKNCLSKEGTVLLMHRVIEENREKLTYYKDLKSVGFAREIFAAIASLRSAGITPEKLLEKIPSLTGGTAEKLTDIALIYAEYEKQLHDKYYDTVSRVELMCERIDDLPYIRDSHIYILGFNIFSDLQWKVIWQMIRVCPSVSIAFCKSASRGNGYCYPTAQRDALIDRCKEEGIPVVVEGVEAFLPEPFATLRRDMFSLWKSEKKPTEEEKRAVRIYAEENPYRVVQSACKEMHHLVFHEGYRYKDFAVVCNDPEYTTVIDTVFARFHIPCFTDRQYMLSNGFIMRFLGALFSCVARDLPLREVCELLSSPLSGIEREKRQAFENYALKYNLSFDRLKKPILSEEGCVAEEVRNVVIELVNKVPKNAKMGAYCDIILEMLASEKFKEFREKCLANKVQELEAYSNIDKIATVVEEIKGLCGEEEGTSESFWEMFTSSIEGMSVSLIPQYNDCVFVGNTENSRFSDIRVLFILGATEGYFPIQKGDALILNCFDTEVMKQSGLPLYPTPMESNLFAKFVLIDLLTKGERLYIGYNENSLTGEKTVAGEGVREIENVLEVEEKELMEYHDFTEEEKMEYFLATTENCYYEFMAGRVPEEYREAVKNYLLSKGKRVEKREKDLSFRLPMENEKERTISVSVLEKYFHCPYSHYLTYTLRLKEREEGGIKPRETGILIHDILKEYLQKNVKRIKSGEDCTKQIDEAIETVSSRPEYERFRTDTLAVFTLEQAKKECREVLRAVGENVYHSAFTPYALELYFGKENTVTVEADGKVFSFKGFIDRVDKCENDVIIIDYKTGNLEPDLRYVYDGEKIQLYVYLQYFLQKGFTPAGVFYLPVHDGYAEKGNSYAAKGQIRRDGVYRNLDNRIPEKDAKYDSPTFAGKLMVDGTGNIKMHPLNKSPISEEDFRNVARYVSELTRVALCDIMEGDMEQNPVSNGCQYCAYIGLCGRQQERICPKTDISAFGGKEDDRNQME